MRESSLKGLSTEEAVGTERAYLQNNADLFSANSPNPCLCWGLTLLLVMVSKMWVTIRELKMEVLARPQLLPCCPSAAIPTVQSHPVFIFVYRESSQRGSRAHS